MRRVDEELFGKDVLEVAAALCGTWLCRKYEDGSIARLLITETEAYRGEEDTACHAHKGRTARTEVLYGKPGTMYVYLCYGMHWLLNAVTGAEGEAQAVLIRACRTKEGPARLTKALDITGEYHKNSFTTCDTLWIETDDRRHSVRRDVRVGIGYASKRDQARKWRFILDE